MPETNCLPQSRWFKGSRDRGIKITTDRESCQNQEVGITNHNKVPELLLFKKLQASWDADEQQNKSIAA